VVRRDIWRQRAIEIRAEFERNRWVDGSLPGGFIIAVYLGVERDQQD
jgi:hypothetical protein